MATRTVCALMVPAILLSWSPALTLAADGDGIGYHESRPLGKLVGELWKRYGFLVTYEEAPYDEATEIVMDTYVNGSRFRRPAWKPITFHGIASIAASKRENLPDQTPAALSIAESAVAEYNSSGNPEQFRVIQDGDYVHIVAVGWVRGGTIEPFQPVLDTKVTFVDSQPRSCLDVLNDLVAQIDNLRGVKLANNFPLNPLLHNRCLIQGVDLTARAAFEQFLREVELPQQNPISRFRYCWTLTHDANADMYFLTVYAVVQPSSPAPAAVGTAKPSPAGHGEAVPGGAQPGGSPAKRHYGWGAGKVASTAERSNAGWSVRSPWPNARSAGP